MNTDKAYLFGLIIGGGIWGNAEDVFRIRLPYKQWGSYIQNPQRASDISRDIMGLVSPLFKNIYGINVSFETSESGVWYILCEGDLTDLISDLKKYDIRCEGELRKNATLKKIANALLDDNLKRRFVAGLADTIASTNPNHRRFTNEVQILSFELKGFNFTFVCELCRLLYSINCLPDQILWNHPNFHCTNDPYYLQWNKGFKLRVQIDQYEEFGAVAFKTKAISIKENRKLQHKSHEAIPCQAREVRATMSCVHPAENNRQLPKEIRGGHYLHNRHVCAVLGCENAPYDEIKKLFPNVGNLINPFPILCKDSLENIESIIASDSLLKNRNYTITKISVQSIYDKYVNSNAAVLLYGNGKDSGYPLTEVMQGIAYIIADNNELIGKRPRGGYKELVQKHLAKNPDLSIVLRIPDLLTPLILESNGRGVLIGAHNPQVYKKLVSIDSDNAYKLCVRPITEKDLKNEE